MEVVIRGHHLPGRTFRVAGVPVHDVHVGIQVRQAAEGLVPADAETATWNVDVRVKVADTGAFDFAGPAVHGARGQRFLYLTWGDGCGAHFAMFRRAKLMLDAIEPALVRRALDEAMPLVGTIDLTDGDGGPRCARVDTPALVWSVG